MRRTRLMTIALALIGLALRGWPVQAQTNTLGISADDYALLKTANSTALNSFAFQYTAQVAIQGLDTFSIYADVKGSGSIDKSAHTLDVSLNGPIQLGTTQNITANTEVELVDNQVYYTPGNFWQVRQDQSTFIANLITQIGGLSTTPAAVAKWDTSGIAGFKQIVAAWLKIDPAAWVTAQRLADDKVSDVQAAHFQINTNLYALMQTKTFVDAMLAISSAQGTALQALNRPLVNKIITTNSALFQNTKLSLDEYIGLDDKLIHRVVLNLNMPLDPSKLGYVDGPFTVTANFDILLSAHNQPQKVAAPTDAKSVAQFTSAPEATTAAPGTGTTEYVYFETIGKKAAYRRSFDVQANDHVTITVRGIGLDFYGVAQLLSADGKMLAKDDGATSHAFALSGDDPQIADFAITKAGTYTAQVTESDGKAGSFLLTITIKR